MVFHDCICFRLGKAVRKVSKAYRRELASYGPTHGQFLMMAAIMEADGLLPSGLADKTARDRATTTGLLGRLEKDGWIKRMPDKRDRRSLRIYLTPGSNKLKEHVLKLFEETNQKIPNRFTPKEWDQMQTFLARLEQ